VSEPLTPNENTRLPGRRLLAVTGISPWPQRGGYSHRAAHLLDLLAAWWDISLVVVGAQEAAAIPCTMGHPHEVINVALSRPWTPVPSFDGEYRPIHDAVSALLARRHFHAALLWPGMEFLAFGRDGFPPAVADRIDCGTLERFRALRHSKATVGEVVRSAMYERRLARELAATAVVGRDDARIFMRISGSKKVAIVPNGVIPQEDPRFEAENQRPTVAFTGTLNYYVNDDAVTHFAREVWPDIRRSVPDARLLIAGRTPSRRVLGLAESAGVEVRAEVADMARVLQEAWVAIAPIRLGTGVKTKVLEAWAAGRPVVMTPLATNGLELSKEMRAFVARRPKTFGALVLQLLSDQRLRQSLGSAALNWVRAKHSWQESAGALSRLLLAVGGERDSH